MAERPQRRQPTYHRGTVLRVERLTTHLIRVILGGETLAGFTAGSYTDHYVKIVFPAPGVTYPEPFDPEAARRDLPREQWPVTRTYTVRAWDPGAVELTIDFVYHGDEGIAGPWAARVRPGEELVFSGPGGGYAPDLGADWHLLAGDESALPAIAAALERLPSDAAVYAFVEVENGDEELKLDSRITWLHREGGQVGDLLVAAVQDLEFPAGNVQVFVHGEANFVKALRRHLRIDRAVPLPQMSISGYWRLGTDEDGWQSGKREWNQQVEAEETAASGR